MKGAITATSIIRSIIQHINIVRRFKGYCILTTEQESKLFGCSFCSKAANTYEIHKLMNIVGMDQFVPGNVAGGKIGGKIGGRGGGREKSTTSCSSSWSQAA